MRQSERNAEGVPVRLKAAGWTLAVAVGVLGLAYLVHQRTNIGSQNPATAHTSGAQAAPPASVSPVKKLISSTAVESATSSTAIVSVQTNNSVISASTNNEARIEQLVKLGTHDDPASLEAILSELTNGDPEIRAAALEACVQFGSRDAIPRLTQLASQTEDAKERLALQHASEFLKLPSLTEVLEEKQREQAARGQ